MQISARSLKICLTMWRKQALAVIVFIALSFDIRGKIGPSLLILRSAAIDGESNPATNRIQLIAAAIFAFLSLVIPAVALSVSISAFGKVNDLPEYYAAARMIISGQGGAIYDLHQLIPAEITLFPQLTGRGVGLFIPPPAVPLLVPIGLVPTTIVPYVWAAILAGSLAFALFLLSRYFHLSGKAILWTVACVCVSGPAYEALRIGQLAPILLLALAASLHFIRSERHLPAALALSVILLKPQELLPIVVFLAGAKQYRLLGWLCGIGVVYSGIAFYEVGKQGFTTYFDVAAHAQSFNKWMQAELSPTVRGQLLRLMPIGSTLPTSIGGAFTLVALVYAYLLGNRVAGYKDWLSAGLIAVIPLGLLTALHCHDYDLLLLLPSLLALVRHRMRKRFPEWLVLFAYLAMVPIVIPFYIYVHYDWLLAGGVPNPLFFTLLAYAGLMSWTVWANRYDFA